MPWSTSSPGVIRSRSSSRVSIRRLRVSSASRSSCVLLVMDRLMDRPRLVLGDRDVALQLMDGLARYQLPGSESARAPQDQEQADQQDRAADNERRPRLWQD